MYYDDINVNALLGKVLSEVKQYGDELEFVTTDGEKYLMYHSQDCCESVDIDDICGDLDDLIGSPILQADEVTNSDNHPAGVEMEYEPESYTWTFYHFATIKGYVTIRWFGQSNGYYSEGVSFKKTK